jgi:hypothetical protein
MVAILSVDSSPSPILCGLWTQVNPLKLISRLKRLQEELPILQEECDKLLAAKQVFMYCRFLFFVTTENLCAILLSCWVAGSNTFE